MNKSLVLSLAMLGMAAGASALVKIPAQKAPAAAEGESTDIVITKSIACNYDGETYGLDVADYYAVISNAEDASYDPNAGKVTAHGGWVVSFDFYNVHTDPATLPEGTYAAVRDPYPDNPAPGTFITEYSICNYYDENGNVTVAAQFLGPVEVNFTDNGYLVTAVATAQNGTTYNVRFEGRLPFSDKSQTQTVYRQLNEDNENLNFVCGSAYYYGMFQTTKGGTMMVQLYTHPLDEDGRMADKSKMICLDIIGRIFPDKTKITIDPGVYEISPLDGIRRGQAGACEERDYMGTTVPLGCYLQDRNSEKYNDGLGTSAYGYLKTGTITITAVEGGYRIELPNGVTDLGYKVSFVYEGPISPILDYSADQPNTAMSTIEDDVDLAISDLPIARVYDNGLTNDCQSLILDIGSRSGRDPERDNGGDIIRLEFVSANGTRFLQPGSYQVMAERWETYYEPWKLAQTHFVSTSSGGTDISGTCYMHFEEGRSYIMDDYAWFTEGSVEVTKAQTETYGDNDVYKFNIDLIADNGFFVKGEWEGPVKLMYDPGVNGVSDIDAEGAGARVIRAGNGIYRVLGYEGRVAVHAASGQLCGIFASDADIDLSAMPAGIYIFNLGNKVFKIIK